MAIDGADVRRIAELARLELSEDQVERMASELSAVLEFVASLQKLDLDGCEPMSFAPAEAPLRDDAPDARRLTTEAALAMAPEAEDGYFIVPPIVEHLNP
jgi:aspartyl-tRNA(Asn)/glutamyl-tRNA(Gln) amidotransferase subunit C